MAPPVGITAVRVRITEPELLENYADFLRGVKRKGKPVVGGAKQSKLRGEAAQRAIETQLGRFVKATVRGGSARLIPDFEINAEEISAPLAAALGLEDVTEIEAKATRGGEGGATIGQASPFAVEGGQQVGSLSLTEAIKSAARQADPGIDIEDRRGVLKAARTAIGGGPKFFNLIKENDPDLFMQFYRKAKLLQIAKFTKSKDGNALSSVDVINISFPLNKFTSPPFVTELTKPAAIVLKLSEAFERQLINSLLDTAPAMVASSTEDFVDQLQSLPGKAKVRGTAAGIEFDMIMEYPSGASIPMTKGRIKGTRKRKGGPRKKKEMQATISSSQLTAAVQRSLFARMPKGPLQGPPLSAEILTNRSGRFVRSVITQVRGSLIRYYYNPIYQVHQDTSRNPNETIEESIRNITQRRVGRQFNVLKGF